MPPPIVLVRRYSVCNHQKYLTKLYWNSIKSSWKKESVKVITIYMSYNLNTQKKKKLQSAYDYYYALSLLLALFAVLDVREILYFCALFHFSLFNFTFSIYAVVCHGFYCKWNELRRPIFWAKFDVTLALALCDALFNLLCM